MCDDSTPPGIDPDDPFVAALSRALMHDGPGADVVATTSAFPALHEPGEIVGTETFDSANDLYASGVRFVDATERDLAYGFDDGQELALRLSPGVLMARLPAGWTVTEAYVQTTTGRQVVPVDDGNYVLFFGALDSPLRLVVICEGAIRCTPWTIV